MKFQIQFPAVTICNQNRISCEKLDRVKEYCESLNKTSNHSAIDFRVEDHPTLLTICNKMYDKRQSIVQYLHEKGKCATVCRNGTIVIYFLFFLIPSMCFNK